MKLHQAIDEVLADHSDGLTAKEIADEIERRGLYVKPSDGSPAPASQITARVGNKTYRAHYEKDAEGHIRRVSQAEHNGDPQPNEEVPERGFVGKMLAAMSEKYGSPPEAFTVGDGIDWSSDLVPIPLYVELPFWLMTPNGDLDVQWSGTDFRVNIMPSWMEVFAVEFLDSRKTSPHMGPWGTWHPPADVAEELEEKGVPLISRPCKTVIRLNSRAHIDAFRAIDPDKEPPRAQGEQRAYWASLCEAHIPVLNELIQRYRLVTYDYFAYELSPWDVPVWRLGKGEFARNVVLLPYREFDSKPVLISDGPEPDDPPTVKTFEFAAVGDLTKLSSGDATPGEFDLLDARNLMERGDYTGAVRRTVTAIEAVLESVFRAELEKKHSSAEVKRRLKATRTNFPERMKQWRELANPQVTDRQIEWFDETRKLRHKIVHNGLRLTHADIGKAQKCVDTGRWLYNKIEKKPDREKLREFGGLNRSVGRLAMTVRFPSTLDSNGITLGPLVFATPGS